MKIKLLTCLLCVFALGAIAQIKSKPKEFVLGYVDRLHSEILKEDRIINIYLPEGYDKDTKYPVIYLLDGSSDEDFIHVVGIVQFNTFPWIARIPKSIVIGIANTNRKRDFTSPATQPGDQKIIPNNGGSANFIAFLEKELQPYVEKKYKTDGFKTIIGQSLGGLLATEILFKKPTLFNNYIIISPSLWWNDGALLKVKPSILEEDYHKPTNIYIGVGKEGSLDGSNKHIMEEDAKLLYEKIKQGQSKSVKVHFDYLPEEDHATVTHQAIFNAFRILYPKK
ncbi:MAG: alpha/beta hydrolase-fold protein [Candidatus Pedobacter colombiensis]|uniref:Alpha/beta hydrolase-fold protein n=1 Tax=Candidatus Pedobacter colombiensis TaxID=3121371 RepID=A0AAJ5W426_9SPHI|nr:alpha/beta hydrolase-fold protein [Pedobacter sp.]WEK18143.1 MAG: alpha/beta hydrolase-fold protein [Pedobacter sp.]